MSTSIEQQVVQMKFDNKQFEAGAAQSMATLDKLKAKLNFKGASKGFEDISAAADSVSLANLTKQTDATGKQFDALAVIAISALNRITNEAMTAGSKLIKSLSIDQVASGWSKYEARTAAVQTLVNATGKSVQQIERYMDKLMLYSDETSYGFDDMTSALATMVSAGGDIDKLVPLLEGFGNAVSFVGKGAAEYKRAVIQLSQGYGANALMLQDWKSIEQTLGGAKQLKQVFIEVGEELNKIEKGEITIGTFNETLKDKWLDQEVMEKALGRFAEMTEKAFEMIEAGEAENVADAYEILSQSVDDYRIKAAKAAQEAKSFTEAIDATKDAVSTKWMESFQIIFGNYEEATRLWTELTNTLWDLFAASGDTRNEILNVWRAFEGREAMIDAAKAAFRALYEPVKAVGDAINEIFFPGTVEQKGYWLANATVAVKEFFESLILSEEAATNLKKAFKLLLIPVYAFYQVLRISVTVAAELIVTIFALANALLTLPSRLGDLEGPLRRVLGDERYEKIVAALATIVTKLGDACRAVGSAIGTIGKSIATAFASKLQGSLSKLFSYLAPIAEWILDRIVDGFEYLASLDYSKVVDAIMFGIDSLIDGFGIILKWCGKGKDAVISFFSTFFQMSPAEVITSIINALKNMKTNLAQFAKSLGFDTILTNLKNAGGNVIEMVKILGDAIWSFVSKLTPAKILVFSFGVSLVWMFMNLAQAFAIFKKIGGGITEVLNATVGTLKAFQSRIKGSPLLQAAVAIGVLAVALGALSRIDSDKLMGAAKALAVVVAALAGLVAAFALINRFLITSKDMANNLTKVSISMLAMAGAAAILSTALVTLTDVNLEGIIGKLFALYVTVGLLTVAVKLLSGGMKTSLRDSVFIIAFAYSLNLMISALAKINDLQLDRSVDNLVTIGIVVGLMIGLGQASKGVRPTTLISMIFFGSMLNLFMKSIEPISKINYGIIIKAILNIISVFSAINALYFTIGMINKFVGKENTKGVFSMAASILLMYVAIKSIGVLDTSVVVKGALAVGALVVFMGVMNGLSGLISKGMSGKVKTSYVSMAAAILILGVAINYIGDLDVKTVAKGTGAVVAMILCMSLLAKNVGTINKGTGVVIAMTVCIGTLVASMTLLTLLDEMELLQVAASLLIAFAGIAAMFGFIGDGLGITKAIGTFAVMEGAILTIGYLFIELSKLDNFDRLLPIAKGIGIVLVAIGASFAMIGKNKVFNDKNALVAFSSIILIMTTMLVEVGGLIAVLSYLPSSKGILERAGAVGIVLASLALSLRILKVNIGKDTDMGSALAAITALSVIAGVIVAVLSAIPPADGILTQALALSMILGVLTLAVDTILLISSLGVKIDDKATKSLFSIIGAVAILGVLSAGLTHWMSSINNVGDMKVKLEMFSQVMMSLLGVFTIITALGKLLELIGAAPKEVLIGAAVVLVAILGVVLDLLAIFWILKSAIKGFGGIDEVIKTLDDITIFTTKLGTAIGAFFGALVGGAIMTAIDIPMVVTAQAIETLGKSLAIFATDIKESGLLDLSVDASLGQTIASLGLGIYGIIDAQSKIDEYYEGVGRNPLSKFSDQLLRFAPDFMEFDSIVSGIHTSAIESFSTCLSSLAEVLVAVPTSGGIWGKIFGDNNIDDFGKGLSSLATGLSDFATTLSKTEIEPVLVDNAVKLTEDLVKIANSIPESGLFPSWFGEQNIATFGNQAKSYAESLGKFVKKIDDYDDYYKDTSLVDTAIEISNKLVEFSKTVPSSDLLSYIVGRKDIGDFGTQLKTYAEGLAKCLKEFDSTDLDVDVVDLMIEAGQKFNTFIKELKPNEGVTTIWKNADLGEFGKQIGNFGEGLANFFINLAKAGDKFSNNKLEAAAKAGKGFAEVAQMLDPNSGVATWGSATDIGKFGKQIGELGEGMATFQDKTSNVSWNRVEMAADALKKLAETGPSLANAKPSNAATFAQYLKDLAEVSYTKFAVAFEDHEINIASSVYKTLSNAFLKTKNMLDLDGNASTLISDPLIKGLENSNNDFMTAIDHVLENLEWYINLNINSWIGLGSNAGNAITEGFNFGVGGIIHDFSVIMDEAIKEMKRTLEIDATGFSGVFYDIGRACADGFSIRFTKEYPKVEKTVTEFAGNIIGATANKLGVNSPSKEFKELGMYTVMGFRDGIDDNAKLATKAMLRMGTAILEAIQDFYGIHSPSTVMRDEVGRYIVQGIAEGITNDMSAEEAAAKKAENIMSAFQDEFNKWSLKTTSAKLDFDLWSATNLGATERETKEEELKLLETKLANQAERVNAANAQYQILLDSGYASAKQLEEARNTFKEEQLSMWELANELIEARSSMAEILDLERAQLEYEQWKLLNADAKEDEIKAKELDVLNKKLEVQATTVATAGSLYNRMLEMYGEDAKATKEALNSYISAQNDMLQLANNYLENTKDAAPTLEDITNAMQKDKENEAVLKQLYEEGAISLEDYNMASMQYTNELVEKRLQYRMQEVSAAELMDKYVADAASKMDDMRTAAEIVDDFMSNASGSIDGIIGNLNYELHNEGVSSAGKNGIGSYGVDMNSIQQEMQETMDEVMEGLNLDFDLFSGDFAGGLIDGIRNNLGGFGNTLVDMAQGGFSALRNFFGIGNDEDSKKKNKLVEFGESVVNFITGGMYQKVDEEVPINAAYTVAGELEEGVKEVPKSYYKTGENAANALAGGMLDNVGKVQAAANTLAAAATVSVQTGLDIHSPSRVFMWIGEMIDQGLANGIEGRASVVTDAIEKLVDESQNLLSEDALSANITPVITDTGYMSQALRMDKTGNVTPTGYRQQQDDTDKSWWISASQDTMQSIQKLSDAEEERKTEEAKTMAEYKQAIDELKEAATKMSDQPTGVNFTQNNYSPKALTSSQIYRNTKTALATASAAASPSGQSSTK